MMASDMGKRSPLENQTLLNILCADGESKRKNSSVVGVGALDRPSGRGWWSGGARGAPNSREGRSPRAYNFDRGGSFASTSATHLHTLAEAGKPLRTRIAPLSESLARPRVRVHPMSNLKIKSSTPIGSWSGPENRLLTTPEEFALGLRRVGRPLYAVDHGEAFGLADGGSVELGGDPQVHGLPLLALAPPCRPQNFGSASFAKDHGVRFCYLAGAMANGVGSVELVEAMGRAGMLAFFGAAGLGPDTVEDAIDRISTRLGDLPWGFNLIHSPYEPLLEDAVADLYVRRGVTRVSASAYMDLTLPLVRYRLSRIHADASGWVVTPNRLVAKVSRIEVARRFLAPAPARMLAELVARGDLSEEQAEMAQSIPVAQDLTVEADSGGHTDNRPAIALLPSMLALRDRMQTEHDYDVPLRVGSAGGISTPHSVAAAFAMGADYVLTGSVNQACREAGTSRYGASDVGPGGAGRCHDGPGGRHVRNGRQVAGAQAWNDVSYAGTSSV